MKIVRFKAAGKTRYGVLEGPHVVEYSGTPFGPFKRGRMRYSLRQAVLLVPVLPSKIVGVGLNYRDHVDETEAGPQGPQPPIFLKPPTALCGPDDPIVYPGQAARVDHGAGLAAVIKKRARHLTADRVREHILGYTCLNDVTARDVSTPPDLWGRDKAFDTFCPVGPCIATDLDPNAVEIEAFVNGERRQASTTKNLMLTVEEVVAYVSGVMTLLPGDVVATGSPAGVGPVRPGDKVEVRIEGIGSLTNPVIRL